MQAMLTKAKQQQQRAKIPKWRAASYKELHLWNWMLLMFVQMFRLIFHFVPEAKGESCKYVRRLKLNANLDSS